jgi:hypothetical protein
MCTFDPSSTMIRYNRAGARNESTTDMQGVWCSVPAPGTPPGPIQVLLLDRSKTQGFTCVVHGMNNNLQEVWASTLSTGSSSDYQQTPISKFTGTPPASVYFFTIECWIPAKELNPSPGVASQSGVYGYIY